MPGSRPPLRWRIFAIFMLISVLPYETIGLIWVKSAYDATRYVMDSIGMVGLAGYAFDRRIGPRSFWRMFAPVFIVFSVAIVLIGLIPFAGIWSGGIRGLPPVLLGFMGGFMLLAMAVIGAMSLALLRYGDPLHGGRSA